MQIETVTLRNKHLRKGFGERLKVRTNARDFHVVMDKAYLGRDQFMLIRSRLYDYLAQLKPLETTYDQFIESQQDSTTPDVNGKLWRSWHVRFVRPVQHWYVRHMVPCRIIDSDIDYPEWQYELTVMDVEVLLMPINNGKIKGSLWCLKEPYASITARYNAAIGLPNYHQ